MRMIPLSGGKAWALVDDEDYRMLLDYKWRVRIMGRTSYAITTIRTADNKWKSIGMHRIIMGLKYAPREIYVDHIDGNGLSNYRTNLRITDNQGNSRNSKKTLSARCTSTYKGVSYNKRCTKRPWSAQITLSGYKKYLGCYRTEEEAGVAYNNAALEHFGEYSNLNIIRL